MSKCQAKNPATCRVHGDKTEPVTPKTKLVGKITVEKLSHTMSHALRHQPEQYELTPTAEGWVKIVSLAHALSAKFGSKVTPEMVELVCELDNKKRYVIKNGLIRAAQGHSYQVSGWVASTPPGVLYHGTSARNLTQVMGQGLKPMSRQHVHLSKDVATATQVGLRHGTSVVLLEIDTVEAVKGGVKFYEAPNGVWLVDSLPAGFIKVVS